MLQTALNNSNNQLFTPANKNQNLNKGFDRKLSHPTKQIKARLTSGFVVSEYIAKELEPEFDSGYSKRQIELFRQFYRNSQLRIQCIRN